MTFIKSSLPHAQFVPWSDKKVDASIAYMEEHGLTNSVGGQVKLLSYHDLYMLLLEVRKSRQKESLENVTSKVGTTITEGNEEGIE